MEFDPYKRNSDIVIKIKSLPLDNMYLKMSSA